MPRSNCSSRATSARSATPDFPASACAWRTPSTDGSNPVTFHPCRARKTAFRLDPCRCRGLSPAPPLYGSDQQFCRLSREDRCIRSVYPVPVRACCIVVRARLARTHPGSGSCHEKPSRRSRSHNAEYVTCGGHRRDSLRIRSRAWCNCRRRYWTGVRSERMRMIGFKRNRLERRDRPGTTGIRRISTPPRLPARKRRPAASVHRNDGCTNQPQCVPRRSEDTR